MIDLMYRAFIRLLACASLVVIASAVVWWWRGHTDEQRKIAELQQQKQELQQVVTRLTTDKRVADLMVTDQKVIDGKTRTQLLFVEYDRTGSAMKPREFSIDGRTAHVEAMVIEFTDDLVMKGDPLRGHALSLFTRIYGENQSPAQGERIDTPGQIPMFYKNTDTSLAKAETQLWQQFWAFEKDETLRKKHGVKIATGKGVWGPFEPNQLYTITLKSDGNLSRTVEPIRGVYGTYIELLRQRAKAE